MSAPPAKAEISAAYPAPNNGQARIGFAKLWDYVTGLLGLTGNASDARALLEVAPQAARVDVASVAGVVNLTAASPVSDDIQITGNLAITGFTVAAKRCVRFVVATGATPSFVSGASLITQRGATIVLRAGDSGTIRAITANNVEVILFARSAPPWGDGYGYVDVTSARASDGTYTNTSSGVLEVSAHSSGNASLQGDRWNAVVDGSTIKTSAPAYINGAPLTISYLVPPGKTYKTQNNGAVVNVALWVEFRVL